MGEEDRGKPSWWPKSRVTQEGVSTGNEPMMKLLLDMSSQMHATGKYVARCVQAACNQAQMDETVRSSISRPDICSVGSSHEPTLREEVGHISEMVRR